MNTLTVEALTFRDRGPYFLRIASGKCLGLMGASGAGKSLLLRAIADLDPHGGRLLLDDMACDQVPAPVWRRQVALLPAESGWWHDRVDEHFRNFGALESDKLARLGFATDVGGWQVSRLSTGEKQRLAVLRMLDNKPRALLLDEPTASLDAANVTAVEKMLLDYGRTTPAAMLWVSHDPDQLARVADDIQVINADGSLTGGEVE
jgi:ABC-type iron transport system FetAB ATPase subunit